MARRRFRTVRRVVLLGLPALLALLLVYVTRVEPRWIQVTHYDVPVDGLPASLDGLRIVQVSDLHRGPRVPDSLIRKAVRVANGESPDIVVLTGDFISRRPENARPCAEILAGLRPRLGAFAVLGNHDHWHGAQAVTDALSSQGIRVLNNESRRVAPGLFMIGIDDTWAGHPDVRRAWSGVDARAGQVLLSHSPVAISLLSGRRCFAITGHTHGGEVIVPFIPRSRLPGLRGFPYIGGWYRKDGVRMYVNRGIGLVNPLRIRFRCRPEISVFTLRSAGTAQLHAR